MSGCQVFRVGLSQCLGYRAPLHCQFSAPEKFEIVSYMHILWTGFVVYKIPGSGIFSGVFRIWKMWMCQDYFLVYLWFWKCGCTGFMGLAPSVTILLSYHHMDYFFSSMQFCVLPLSFSFVIAYSTIHAFPILWLIVYVIHSIYLYPCTCISTDSCSYISIDTCTSIDS